MPFLPLIGEELLLEAWHHSTGNAFLTLQEGQILPPLDPSLCFNLIALSDWPSVCVWLAFVLSRAQASTLSSSPSLSLHNVKLNSLQNAGQSGVKRKIL